MFDREKANKITATLKLVVTEEFYDDEASEETLRSYVEQCLEEAGFSAEVGLFKVQEPRVLTLEETEACEDSVWLEKNIPEWEEPIPVLVNETNKYLDTFTSRSGWRFQGEKSRGYGEYGKTWRCWSARPTDEQREAVPWDENR